MALFPVGDNNPKDVYPIIPALDGSELLPIANKGTTLLYLSTGQISDFISPTGGAANTALSNLSATAVGADLSPGTDNAFNLGDGTHGWKRLSLSTGGTINAGNGNAVITHSTGAWTVSAGDWRVTTAGTNAASVVTVGGVQTLTNKTLTAPTIAGGTIDSAVIGAGTPANGTFNTLSGNVIATGSTSTRSLANRFGNQISPLDFGAVGDGTTNDTTAVQTAFDYAVDNNVPIFGLGKIYLVDNLSLKNRDNGAEFEPILRAFGGGATIKKRSSADNSYLVATQRWVTSSAFGNYPFQLEDWVLDGNDIATNVLVDTSFASKVRRCFIKNSAGRGISQPTVGRDGSTNITSSRAECFYEQCRIYSNAGTGFANDDTVSTSFISDCTIAFCEIMQNGKNLDLQQSAGFFIQNNRIYSHTNAALTEGSFIEDGFTLLQGNTWGSPFSGKYALTVRAESFPQRIVGDNFQLEAAAGALGLNCDFGAFATIIQVESCRFEGATMGINHNTNAATATIISKNNVFDQAVPYTFSGGAAHAGVIKILDDRANVTDPTIITPTQITSDQNNYNPAGLQYAHTLLVSSDAARTITGFQKGALDRYIAIYNVGAQNIILASNSGSSSAGNRMFLRASRTLTPGDSLTLWYDIANGGWREFASSLG